MKIAIILRELLISGGGERQGLMLARELISRGHAVTVYTTAVDREKCFPKDTATLSITAVPAEELAKIRAKKFFLPHTLATSARESALARALAQKIDRDTEVLNPNDNWGMRVGYYFKKNIPGAVSVVMLNDVDTARWTLFDDPLFGKKKKNAFKYFLSWCKDMSVRRYVRAQGTIVVLSDRTGDLVKKYLGQSTQTVRSGVDHEQFKFVPRTYPKKGETIRLLSHGIFYIHRRYEDTIRAVLILKKRGFSIKLTIIGDYTHKAMARTYYDMLRTLVSELGLQNDVHFSGRVSDEELIKSFYNSDAFISAAHMQTWGIAPFEALATGLPVAVSKTIGASEILEDGVTAVKFEPGDPENQAEAILRLFENAETYEKLSREGNAFVKGRLSWKRYADDMLEFFTDVLSKKKSEHGHVIIRNT